MDAVLKGLISGITISVLIGPIFIALVDITISKGWRSSLFFVLGIIVSDLLLIASLNQLLQVFPFIEYKVYIGALGGIVLLAFGIITFFSSASLEHTDIRNIKTYFGAFLKGVTINILNPFVVLWWVGIHTTLISFGYSNVEKVGYYTALLSMVFLFDLLKIRFAYYIKHRLTIEKLNIIKKIAGVCLFAFGILMIIRVVCY
jgi:threonine/homoserine/homoserine lactone efflux protein